MNAVRFTARRSICTFALALIGFLGASGSPAQAQQQKYIAGVVGNRLPVPITYQYKIANGDWKTVKLAPGQKHYFSFRTPQEWRNQVVTIRYDSVADDGGRVTLDYRTLGMHGCTDPKNGLLAQFIVVNSGKNILLR